MGAAETDASYEDIVAERYMDGKRAVRDHFSGIRAPEKQYEELVVLVHPGYAEYNPGVFDEYCNATPEAYEEFEDAFFTFLDERDDDTVTYALYPADAYEETRAFLDGYADDVTYVETMPRTAAFESAQQKPFANMLNQVKPDGQITLAGELNGICVDNTDNLIRYATSRANKPRRIRYGPKFPEKKVKPI